MSLYLKYRPQDFSSIVGQAHIVTTLKNALKHEALTHAYLFCGTRGTGKTSTARIVAKSLNCTNLGEGYEPCNTCENCEAVLNGRLVDLIEIDAASNRGIDEIRELREKILFAPTQGKYKVYIIDEVHMLTKEAFNALLKTLEEPPEHAYFILATTEAHKIPETIISRCQQFNFRQIEKEDIIGRLQEIATAEKIHAEPDALELIAKMSRGSLRDAIGLLDQMNIDNAVIYQEVINKLGITGHMLIEEFYEAIQNKEAVKAIDIIEKVNQQGHNLAQFCGEWIAYLREKMLGRIDRKESPAQMIESIDIFLEAKKQINGALIPQLPLEIAVIKACGYEVEKAPSQPATVVKIDEVVIKEKITPISTLPPQGQELKDLAKEDVPTVEITIEKVKENWQRILQNVKTPFLKMSLIDAEPVGMEKSELSLTFNSSTLMEKVMNPTNQNEIIDAFKEVLGTKIQLKSEVKKITLKPVTPVEKVEEDSSVLDMAKEVFGN